MTTKATQPLLSTGSRAATALAVVALVAAAWTGSVHESHQAVRSATAALSTTYVTLPRVEIVARRQGAGGVAAAAAGAAHEAL